MEARFSRLIAGLTASDGGRVVVACMLVGFGLVLVGDWLTPLGFAHGTLYLPFVLLSLFAGHAGWILFATLTSIALTAVGYLLSPLPPAGITQDVVLANRLFSAVAIAITGGLLLVARAVIQHMRDAQAQLREQYQLVEVAQRFGRLGGWTLDLSSGQCYWSDEVARIHGMPPGYSPNVDDGVAFYAPEYREGLRAALGRCANDGEAFDREMQLVTADGERIWVRSIGRPARDDEGRITHVEGAFQSIEQFKSIEAALSAARERFQRFADVLPLVIWTARPDGTLDYSSPHIETFTGVPRHDVIAEPTGWLQLVHPEDREAAAAAWQHSVATGEEYDVEFRIRSGEGHYEWHLNHGYPVCDANGEVLAWFGTATNIDTLKQLEQSARNLAERLDNTLDAIQDGFVSLDRDWRFSYVNQHAEQLLDQPAGDLQGRTLWQALPAILGSSYEETFRSAMALRQARRFDAFYRPMKRWFSIHLHPTPEGLTALFRDTTREHALMAQLQASQRLESVGQLTAGVAHDFNNLLTVVMGNTALLREEAPDHMQDLLEQISLAAHQGSDLTYRLLAFARMQPLEPRAVAVDGLIAGMRNLLDRTLGADIQLSMEAEPDLWPAEVDPTQLESALLNLCLNARDAMAGGGTLSIDARNITLDAEQTAGELDLDAGDYVLIRVSDTGVGIPEDLLDRVLEPFFTTKPKGEGSGLGLAMVYGFMKQSRGHLRLTSEEGSGTTVRLYLPRATTTVREDPAPSVVTAHSPLPGGSETILVVEDEASVRRVARSHLAALGYRTIEARNALEALAVLHRQNVDLLFTDVVMPGGMNGRELADTARSLRPGLKVLYTSGYTENVISDQGALEPGVNLLSKPYRHTELARRVREILDQPHWTERAAQN